MTGPPGAGKTTGTQDLVTLWAKEGRRTIIFRPTHRQIEEDLKRLRQLGVRPAVWMGFEHKCPRYQGGDELIVRLYKEARLPPEVLCRICDRASGCPYKAQFKTSARVILAPVDYLWTGYPELVRPDAIVIDEPGRWLWLPEDPDKLKEKGKTLDELIPEMEGWRSFVEKHIAVWCRGPAAVRRALARSTAVSLKELLDAGASLNELVEEGKRWIPYDIVKLTEYEHLRRLYGRDQFYILPFQYPALDYVRAGYLVIYVDAYHDEELTGYLLERYKKERGQPPELNVIPVKAPAPPPGRIIRVRPFNRPGWYPKESLKNERTRERLAQRMIGLARRHKAKKVGVITYKEFLGYFVNALKRALPGVDVVGLHFFNLRSSNALRDVGVLFVVGTAVVNLGELEGLIVPALLPHKNLSPKAVKLPGGGWRYVNPYVEAVRRYLEDYEQANAIHRARPMVRPVTVYVFGRIPDCVLREEGLPVGELIAETIGQRGGLYIRWVKKPGVS